MSPEAEGKSAPDEETPYGEPPLPAYVTETTDGAAETEESIVVPDLPDLPDAPVEMREPVPEEVVVDAIAAAPELAVATPSVTTHPAVDPNENERMVASLASPVVPSKKVLGTYNAGGRTYSMYADGSVEAATESGVERFSSMDELRRHLVKT